MSVGSVFGLRASSFFRHSSFVIRISSVLRHSHCPMTPPSLGSARPSLGSAGDTPLLAVRGLTKAFPGVRALDGVDFTLRRGEIHALMGANGAGKSTLIKVLTGVYRRDAGEILFDGQSIDPRSPGEAQRMGISTVYQEVNLVTVL